MSYFIWCAPSYVIAIAIFSLLLLSRNVVRRAVGQTSILANSSRAKAQKLAESFVSDFTF